MGWGGGDHRSIENVEFNNFNIRDTYVLKTLKDNLDWKSSFKGFKKTHKLKTVDSENLN